jgi:hypothetical protein
MSKRYIGKTCTYCTAPHASVVGDHVLAREFCLKHKRANLPQVPACDVCNGEKSRLEHELTAVMPFGGRHPDSRANLSTMVAPRLAKNRKLAATLAAGMRQSFESNDGIAWQPAGTVPIDTAQLVRLYELMAQGLAYWNWGVLLPQESCIIYGTFLTAAGENIYERLFGTNRVRRVRDSLSDGVLEYEGIQDPGHSEFTAWRMSLYGTLLSGDAEAPAEIPSRCHIITAPRSLATAVRLIESMRNGPGRVPA